MRTALVTAGLVLICLSACARGPAEPVISAPVVETTEAEIATEPSTEAGGGQAQEPNAGPEKKRRRFLGFLRKNKDADASEDAGLSSEEPAQDTEIDNAALEAALGEALEPVDIPALGGDGPSATDAEIAERGPAADAPNAPSRKPRFLGFLRKRTPGDTEAGVEEAAVNPKLVSSAISAEPAESSADEAVSMTDEEIAAAGDSVEGPEPSRRPRLLGFLRKRTPGDAAPATTELASIRIPNSASDTALSEDIPDEELPKPTPMALPDSVLPFGEIVRDCDVKKRKMGKLTDRSPAPGGLKLFDPIPNSTAPRTQFITGFKDGCARRLTGALVLFGAHDVHEATRYASYNDTPWSALDKKYERIKNRICKVRRRVPCPEGAADKLAAEVAFLTVYRSFGSSGEWLEVLLYKGEIAATNLRRN